MYPALSILQAIGNRASEVLWVGGEGGMEAELIASRSIPFKAVPAAGVHGVGLSKLPGNLWKLLKGVAASRKILREFAPDVLLFTGGFVAVPMALAGISRNSLLYVPDIEPGLALRTLARFSDLIALTAEPSKEYFGASKKTAVTGYPTRADFVKMDKAEARKKLGLKQGQPVLLIVGGSKGAHLINTAVLPNLTALLPEFQVVHVSGTSNFEECQQFQASMAPQLKANYHLYPYLYDEVSLAFSAADLAISRAGASILGELPLMGLPAVLVPYPFAWRYQKVNADYLVQRGAAVVVNNSDLQEQLLPTIKELFSNPTKLDAMSRAMSALATPQAAAKLADLVCQLAKSAQGGKHD